MDEVEVGAFITQCMIRNDELSSLKKSHTFKHGSEVLSAGQMRGALRLLQTQLTSRVWGETGLSCIPLTRSECPQVRYRAGPTRSAPCVEGTGTRVRLGQASWRYWKRTQESRRQGRTCSRQHQNMTN